MKTQLLVLTALVAALAFSISAQAQNCGGGYGCGYDYGYLYNSLEYNVPYYAAHPPVYYSYPVPRTYGYSPFAYPPGVMTPDVAEESTPLEITNPYVPSTKQEKSANQTDTTAARKEHHVEPLVIINPYVSSKGSIAGLNN